MKFTFDQSLKDEDLKKVLTMQYKDLSENPELLKEVIKFSKIEEVTKTACYKSFVIGACVTALIGAASYSILPNMYSFHTFATTMSFICGAVSYDATNTSILSDFQLSGSEDQCKNNSIKAITKAALMEGNFVFLYDFENAMVNPDFRIQSQAFYALSSDEKCYVSFANEMAANTENYREAITNSEFKGKILTPALQELALVLYYFNAQSFSEEAILPLELVEYLMTVAITTSNTQYVKEGHKYASKEAQKILIAVLDDKMYKDIEKKSIMLQ